MRVTCRVRVRVNKPRVKLPYFMILYSRAPANGGMGVGGGRSNGVSAGAQAQIEDLTTQVFLIDFFLDLSICDCLIC